ncbi:hypothetical protein [Rhizobium alvei]|uniref:Uncharacterized protein n=1 Tax=Rhizobium alvei TaxID=1132659 RepID=A0ABT8YT69_9HYPH|nr:hypothetical protein [Rhizobium alvei]MDO6966934.1 hypothetical protein [Rhizobium alvei]
MNIAIQEGQRALVVDSAPTGTTGFISWERLAKTLCMQGETVFHIKANEDGLSFYVRWDENR